MIRLHTFEHVESTWLNIVCAGSAVLAADMILHAHKGWRKQAWCLYCNRFIYIDCIKCFARFMKIKQSAMHVVKYLVEQ